MRLRNEIMLGGGDWLIYFCGERVGRVMKFEAHPAKERWGAFAVKGQSAKFRTRGEAAQWVRQQAREQGRTA